MYQNKHLLGKTNHIERCTGKIVINLRQSDTIKEDNKFRTKLLAFSLPQIHVIGFVWKLNYSTGFPVELLIFYDSTTWLKVFFESVDEILLKLKPMNRFK